MKLTKIGDFLKRSKIPIDILDSEDYSRVTIRINHNGVSLRDTEVGKKIGTKKQFILKAGQFIVSKIDARYGAFGIAPSEVDNAIITGNFWAYDVDFSKLNIEWFNQFTNSPDFYDLCERASAGITHRKYLNESFFLNYEIMLPSVEEQLIQIEKIKLQKISFSKLTAELTQQLDLIKKMRQAFLREAMQGKLVKSTNSKKTGQQLLVKIKAEKAQLIAEKKLKKQKEIAPISEDVIPFEIPEHWAWCRLGEVLKEIKYGTSQSCDYDINKNSAVLRIPNVSNGEITIEDLKYTNLSDKERTDLSLEENDILIVRSNGSRELVGKTALVKKELIGFCYAGYLIRLRYNSNLINSNYLWLVTKSPFFREMIETPLRTTVGINNINTVEISLLKIPLPPLHEQEQIVTKLEELMSFCDGLEESIKKSQGYNEMLLQQVLREALQPKEGAKVISLENRKLALPLKTVLGAHIVDVCNTIDFGRVKFQKLLFLTEYYCKIDFESHYVQKAAGPHDDALIKSIENEFKRQRFFEVKQENSETNRVRYTKLPNASQINSMFLENFGEEAINVNNLLMRLRAFSWVECEVIATIYAVWNNRLIKGQTITDESLFEDFMAWSSRKSNFSKDFYKKLLWMREENIVPDGWGKYVDKPEKKMV